MIEWFFVGLLNLIGWWLILRNNLILKFVFGEDGESRIPMSLVVGAWIVGFLPHLQYFMLICLGCFFVIGTIAFIGKRYSDFFSMSLSDFEKRISERLPK